MNAQNLSSAKNYSTAMMPMSLPLPIPMLLVVDDREANLESMQVLLGNDKNWRLRCAASGEEALRLLLHEDVSLVLLDVQMPGMDGYEMAELMRRGPKTRHTPIIFISAIAHTHESIMRGYNSGAIDFILKPFDPVLLRHKVQNLLALENNRRALLHLSQQLEQAYAFNDSILANAAEGIMVVDENGLIQYANPAIAQMVESDIQTLQGKPFLHLLEQSDKEGEWQESQFYRHCRNHKVYRSHEATLLTRSGSNLPVSLSCATLPQPQKAMVVIARDIAIERDLNQQLEALIITDPLTGLLNRRGFYQAAEQALARTKRTGNHLAVIYLDLDGFKKINDSLGHNVGDELLQHVARQIKSVVRPYDSIARLGGDEFTILLDALNYCRDAAKVADKLMQLLSTRYEINGEAFNLSASVGIACYPECGEDIETLLRAADMAMYDAKDNGRQCYRFHSPQMTARAHARLEIEKNLRHAIEQKCFSLAFQPQFYLDSGRLRGFEALLRWPKGNPNAFTPEQFIPQLEETRLINPLGQWIFSEGIAYLAKIQRHFGDEPLLSLNVSPMQFAQPQLIDNLAEQLDIHGVRPAQLELEVTESVLMRDLETTHIHLRQLRQLGISVAIDDFGTGYSSLAYLRQFELDILKIDRMFVTNMIDSPRDAAVVNTIIDLARHLGLQVIAEGVETQAQRQWLSQHNCAIMQGYLAAPALPFDAAVRLPAQLDWTNPQIVQS